MKCDSWASFLALTLASPCFGHEFEVRVVITINKKNVSIYLDLSYQFFLL